MKITKTDRRLARKRRIRARVAGTATCPRLTVYRSLTRLIAQLIDDQAGKTLAYVTTTDLKTGANKEGAKKLGEKIAAKAKDLGISAVVFDRNGYKYHGRIQELAEAARAGGLKF
jgi:large subunit ribosomal protein L18